MCSKPNLSQSFFLSKMRSQELDFVARKSGKTFRAETAQRGSRRAYADNAALSSLCCQFGWNLKEEEDGKKKTDCARAVNGSTSLSVSERIKNRRRQPLWAHLTFQVCEVVGVTESFLPRCHHHRLLLTHQGEGVRDAPLLLALPDLAREKTTESVRETDRERE